MEGSLEKTSLPSPCSSSPFGRHILMLTSDAMICGSLKALIKSVRQRYSTRLWFRKCLGWNIGLPCKHRWLIHWAASSSFSGKSVSRFVSSTVTPRRSSPFNVSLSSKYPLEAVLFIVSEIYHWGGSWSLRSIENSRSLASIVDL